MKMKLAPFGDPLATASKCEDVRAFHPVMQPLGMYIRETLA